MSEQPWQLPPPLPPPDPDQAENLAALQLPEELLAVLRRRGFESPETIAALLEPPPPPDPLRHFPDLRQAVQRLSQACRSGRPWPSAATTTPTA
jgi:single-stranded-DNA-specific exonuclease